MNRRWFIRAVPMALAAAVCPPLLALDPAAANGLVLLRENWVANPQSFGFLYQAMYMYKGFPFACCCEIATLDSEDLKRVVRADALTHMRIYGDRLVQNEQLKRGRLHTSGKRISFWENET